MHGESPRDEAVPPRDPPIQPITMQNELGVVTRSKAKASNSVSPSELPRAEIDMSHQDDGLLDLANYSVDSSVADEISLIGDGNNSTSHPPDNSDPINEPPISDDSAVHVRGIARTITIMCQQLNRIDESMSHLDTG